MYAVEFETQVVNVMQDLSFEQKRSVLEFGLFLKSLSTSLNKNKSTKRLAGLGKTKSWLSKDFNDELPDNFWLSGE
jgi:hypothetical protein